MAEPLVELRDVHRRFADREVLRGVSLRLEKGELCAITGPSGSGKSTLLHVVGGLDRSFTGHVRVCGQDLAGLSDEALSRLRNEHIGFVFQSFHLLEHVSCLENVTLPDAFSPTPLPPADARSRAEQELTRVGLFDRRHDLPAALSGGQKQRVAIARALFQRPQLLLCDEPTGNLDRDTGQQIIDLFTALHQEGQTLLIVTHEERVSRVADRVIRLSDGQIAAEAA